MTNRLSPAQFKCNNRIGLRSQMSTFLDLAYNRGNYKVIFIVVLSRTNCSPFGKSIPFMAIELTHVEEHMRWMLLHQRRLPRQCSAANSHLM